ncbi:MAG: class I SAM-dependent RNA methyltransferase [Leptospirales bacterium]|nr:class I SAM-dependent RNA methyltransferase [Leptospirales bacterium]
MSNYKLIASCSFGIESIAARELKNLGIDDLKTENGRIEFTGTLSDLARCNIHLRCAERVYVKLAEFKASDFEELFQGALSVDWGDILPKNAFIHVIGKSVKSKLHSIPDCQSIVKKAIITKMSSKYGIKVFPEDGAVFKIEISILKDMVILSLDSSGAGLHKRGYREDGGAAPLRETLAAALIYLSRWKSDRPLADPLCGSGTIAIEAALIGRNISSINRNFDFEKWGWLPDKIVADIRSDAKSAEINSELEIFASDFDFGQFKRAKENAQRAGVSDSIVFQKKPVSEFSVKKKYGCIITNPPYGERISDIKNAESLYIEMGKVFKNLDEWSIFIITAHENFQKLYGYNADKNRKLYNGKIKTYLYQYLAKLPPKVD